MNDRERLIELANEFLKHLPWGEITSYTAKELASYLISHGVTFERMDGEKDAEE